MKFFKHVTELDCIYCKREFPLDTKDFMAINKHGWGCCADCWEDDYPNKTANNSVYIPPAILAAMHEKKKSLSA